MIKPKALLIPVFLLFFSSISLSEETQNYTDPEQLLFDLLDYTSQLKNQNLSPDEEKARLHNILNTYFDPAYTKRWILGRHWKVLSKEQKHEFTTVFSNYFISTFISKSLNKYNFNEGDLRIITNEEYKKGHYRIHSEYQESGQAPLKLDWFIIKNRNSGFHKIRDVRIEGISLLMNWRSQVQSTIRSKGFEGLIEELKSKTKE